MTQLCELDHHHKNGVECIKKHKNENENDIMLKMIRKFHVDNDTFFDACTKVLYTRKRFIWWAFQQSTTMY
jgi:hypothetical protein